MKNEAILNQLYDPNDRLGVEMFGVEGWNKVKGRACGVTNSVISRRFRPATTSINPNYTNFFNALFRPNREKFAELLGATAPIDYIPGEWARGLSDLGHGVTEMLNQFAFFKPWISGGRSINSALAKFMEAMGLESKKPVEEETPPAVKYVYGFGTVLLIVGGIWALWYFSRPKPRRRRRRRR